MRAHEQRMLKPSAKMVVNVDALAQCISRRLLLVALPGPLAGWQFPCKYESKAKAKGKAS